MKPNTKLTGRLIRGVLGPALMVVGLYYERWWVVAIGCFILFEAVSGWCVIHQVCGKNECNKKPQ